MTAGEPFDAYLKRHVFEPLNMRHTYTAIEDAQRDGLASGYRYWFGFPVASTRPGTAARFRPAASSPQPRT